MTDLTALTPELQGEPSKEGDPSQPSVEKPAPQNNRRRGEEGGRNIGLRAQFLRAGVTGILTGLVAVTFNLIVRLGEEGQHAVLDWAHRTPLGFFVWPIIAALLAVFSVWLTHRFAPEAAGSGIPHIKGVLHHTMQLRWRRVLPVKLIGGFAALASGLSLGREGPTVQMGAATAQLTARFLRLPRRSHNQLVAAGAGAGLAAAFNSPLAGFIFVIEELRRELSPLTSSIALIAAITADVVSRSLLGQRPSFLVHGVPTPPLLALPLFLLIGVIAAFLGWAFNRSLLKAVVYAQRIPFNLRILYTAALAACIGLAAWWWPTLSGGGYANAQEFLSGRLINPGLIPWLLLMLALRFVLTILSYATGAPGGIFAPMLAMGASLGLACGLAVTGIWPHTISLPVAFAVVAMAALFAAVVRAPLTGIVLILEMTANYELLLPLMIAAMTAFLVAERLKLKPIYESLLELNQPEDVAAQEGALWLDIVIESDSALEGTAIRDLGWPKACRIVTLHRAGKELAPRSFMELRAGDHLRIVMDAADRGFARGIVVHAREPLASNQGDCAGPGDLGI